MRSLTGLSGFLMKCNNDIISVNSYLSLPPLPLQSNIHFLFLAKIFLKNENFPKDDITQSCKAKKMPKLGALCKNTLCKVHSTNFFTGFYHLCAPQKAIYYQYSGFSHCVLLNKTTGDEKSIRNSTA